MRVMLSAAGSPAAVSIIRHLRSLGNEVVGLDAAEEAAPLGRAFCDEFHVSPLASSHEYVGFLLERLGEVDVFLPFIDEELVCLTEHWAEIPSELAARIALSEPTVVAECVDKCLFQKACENVRLPIAPEARDVPAYFKPRYGRGGKGVVEIRDQRMLDAIIDQDGILQRAIEGKEFTVDAIFDTEGTLVATSSRRRLRASGVSTVGYVSFDQALHELARALGQRWKFKYAINFQVIRDRHDRNWIIELNPRLAGSAIFSTLAGCDPFAATLALWRGESWHGSPRSLHVYRYWHEITDPL